MPSRPPILNQPVSCWHLVPLLAGVAGLFLFGVGSWMSFFDGKGHLWTALIFIPALAGCVFMLLYAGKMTVDASGVTKVCLLGTYFIAWESISYVWTGAGNMVIGGENQRLVLPGPEHWIGGDADAVKHAVGQFCQLNGISIMERLSAMVTFTSQGTRV